MPVCKMERNWYFFNTSEFTTSTWTKILVCWRALMKGTKNNENYLSEYFSPKLFCNQLQCLEIFFLLHYFHWFKMLGDWRKEENINADAAFNCRGPNPQLSLISSVQQKLMNPHPFIPAKDLTFRICYWQCTDYQYF